MGGLRRVFGLDTATSEEESDVSDSIKTTEEKLEEQGFIIF